MQRTFSRNSFILMPAFSRSAAALGVLLAAASMCLSCASAAPLSQTTDPSYKLYLQQLKDKGLTPGESIVGESADDIVTRWSTVNIHEPAKFNVVDVKGQSFTKAIQVDAPKAKFYWSQQLQIKNQTPIKKGDLVFMTFYARNLVGGDLGKFAIEAKSAGGFEGQDFGLSATDDWEPWYSSFTATRDLAPGDLTIHVMFGEKRQIIQIGGFMAANMGQADRLKLPARTLQMNYEGREPDAPWRKEALARIDKIRKGNLTVTVKDATGKVVPNAEVKVEMTRHAFKFGSTIPPGFYPGSKVKAWADFAGIADAPESIKQQYRDHFFRWFNYTHGPAVWGYYKGLEQRITEEDTKEAMRYWHSQGLRLGGGQIVYPRPEFTPAFANKLMKEGKSAEFRQAIKDWIFEAGRTFGPYVESFQIANEFEGSPYYTDVLGGDPYDHIAQWFKWSKEAAPNVRTMINDPGATDAYYERIAEVLKRGGPIELIGLQNHSSFGGPSPSRRLKELDRFAQFKLPIEITEMEVTIRDGSDAEQRAFQGDYFRDQLIAYFSHPAVEGIVLQDFWEGYVWQKDKFPAPMSTDFKTLYPHGKAYENLVLNQWWTREGGKANAKGEYSTRGFFGDYKVTVTANGKTKIVTTLLSPKGQKLEVRLD